MEVKVEVGARSFMSNDIAKRIFASDDPSPAPPKSMLKVLTKRCAREIFFSSPGGCLDAFRLDVRRHLDSTLSLGVEGAT